MSIDVGRSSWPLDRPFVTLLPATMLMSPAESKEEKNRSGVRMFRADDFLAPASGESWDRLRLTCSQPFRRHQSFGLAFLRVRSPVDPSAEPVIDPFAPGGSELNRSSSDVLESDPRPWLTNPSIRRMFFPEPHTSTEDIPELKGLLRQLQPGPPGRAARMLLSAAQKASAASVVSPKHSRGEPGPSHPKSAEPRAEEQNRTHGVGRRKRRKSQDQRPLSNSSSQPNQKGAARARRRQHRPQTRNDNGVQATGQCPICTGSFSVETLPLHAATCGESSPPQPASPSSSSSTSVLCVSSPESSPPPSWVQCPICDLPFLAGEIEEHASLCGEVFPA
ncbi:putative short transient receptor potential channel 2-like protein isoform X5 [Arvicola amphibius]|uniref:putative short transient receptor potential channel 2-like protein isoform X5 n=1 Tax=Arvicola amphibius TaxID=1047088 RepID=UPI0018E36ACB|nr:putative short transient receptor potential channel 2-like protein isoform X5 [Arvicola amphibius]XP_038178494.1 putative short transient receptor potential channel 2-like protein isoform X5 [Arvicola amphibius]XP_038178504.1 putative short transient receptor potential channel 2-like protein isoform X5 [Arvicola amphibius]